MSEGSIAAWRPVMLCGGAPARHGAHRGKHDVPDSLVMAPVGLRLAQVPHAHPAVP